MTNEMNKRFRLPVDSCDETSVNSPPRKEAKAHNGARIELIPESSREARAAATLGHASACTSSVVFSSAAPPQIAVSSTTTTSSKQQKSPSVAAALQQALVSTSSAEQEKSPVEKSPTPKAI
ncbi:hypothetical protein L596_001430 [Steinernema carpocapsae]|uniref:Uncharacterized protein n=1 Tax=Steinernema carpocapsae TaxID=34508 RepID=A0A4U8UL83_STECR|nr:hypothetical protein L596_001430 [Steinernema carpocapsae]